MSAFELIPVSAAPVPVFVSENKSDAEEADELYGNEKAPVLSVAGAHCVPLYFNTIPEARPVLLTATPRILFTVGLGYEPPRSPPAPPLGGNEVGIRPAANFELVTDASRIFAVVTELSASLVVVTAPVLIVGLV
jgi:hypothetical protein